MSKLGNLSKGIFNKEFNMGMIKIKSWGSFPEKEIEICAIEHGHAHAVAEAISYLSSKLLPQAISLDHRLHEEGAKPNKGFEKA
jgi:hypothetical protein